MSKTTIDWLEITSYSSNPTDTDASTRGLAAVGTDLKFWDGTSWNTVAESGAGGGGTPSWENIFSADDTFTVTPDTTFTIAGNRSTATDVVTLTNVAGGSGDVIKIQNAGSGADISGTSDTWTISKAGAATFVGITPGGDITSTSTAIDWDIIDDNASALSIDAGGAAGLLVFDTTNGSEVVKTAAGTFQVTQGKTNLIQASNTVSALVVTDNTATTFGADANSSGVAVFRSTSLTTGSLLQLQLTEGTLNGGFYLTARDVTGSANVFTVGENGATVIAGAGAANALTVTAGDAVMSDGSLAITDADNAASLSVTNNTVTTADAMVDISSTSISTGALMRLNANTTAHDGEVLEIISAGDATSTPTGISVTIDSPTTGAATGLAITMAGATTTAKGISVTMDALTTGDMLYLDNGGGTITGDGKFINCNDDDTSVFSVAASGATTIAGSAALTAALTITAGDFVMSDGAIQVSTNAGVTADAGSAQGGEPITRTYTEISTVGTGGDAVTLPTAAAGRMVLITNHGANAADVFPASGDAINEGAANAATSIAANETFLCIAYDSTNWEVLQLARNS